MRLNELRAALEAQFANVVDIVKSEKQKSNQQTYVIDDCAAKIFVEMRREKGEEIDDHAAICGGKLCIDYAQVTINTPNEQVNKVVVAFFTQMLPEFGFGGPQRLFDHVTINGKQI